MRVDPLALLTILGMAFVTYATRFTGVWLMGRVPAMQRLDTWLSYIPGAVLTAIVAPAIFDGGMPDLVAAVGTVLVMIRTRSMLAAMAAGVVLVWLLRMLPL
jgi:uncharacterized membrane protein